MTDKDLLYFGLDGLLPSNTMLIVDCDQHIVSRLSNEGNRPMVKHIRITHNQMCILLPLLFSYPHYCPYEELLTALYPLVPPEQYRAIMQRKDAAEYKSFRTSLRNARNDLAPDLHKLGLSVGCLRGLGYLLTLYTEGNSR